MTYEIELKKNAICKAGGVIVQELQAGNKPTDEILFELNKATNQFEGFSNEVNNTNKVGIVTAVRCEGNEEIPTIINDLNKIGYTAKAVRLGEQPNIIVVSLESEEKAANDTVVVQADGEIGDLVKDIVERGLSSEAEMTERLEVFKQNRVDDNLVAAILRGYRRYDRPCVRPKTAYVDVHPEMQISLMSQILVKVLMRHPVVFEGDKSVGKDVMAETVAWLCGMPCGKVVMNENMTSEDMTGARTTKLPEINMYSDEEAKQLAILETKSELTDEERDMLAEWSVAKTRSMAMQLTVEDTPVMHAMIGGGVAIIDEMNLGDANTLAGVLNGAADGSKAYETATHGRIKINPDFILIGTQNVALRGNADAYLGTNDQNSATESRFSFVPFEYPSTIMMILKKACKKETIDRLPESFFKQCDKWYCEKLTKGYQNGSWGDGALNVRGIVRALDEVAAVNIGSQKAFKPLIPLRDALMSCVVNCTHKPEERQSLRLCLEESI